MKPLEFRIKVNKQDMYEDTDAIPTESRCLDSIIENIESGKRTTLSIHPQCSLERLTNLISKHFGDKVTIRDGVTGGCYGARDGSSYNGLTLWLDASLFPDRFIDDDGDEVVNIASLIENYGGELVEDLDGHKFEEVAEALGHKVEHNNTYNYAGHSGDDPHFLFDSAFAVVEGEDCCFLSIMFHCGGDVRGNYTDKVVYKFGSIDDVHGVIYPTMELKGGDNE